MKSELIREAKGDRERLRGGRKAEDVALKDAHGHVRDLIPPHPCALSLNAKHRRPARQTGFTTSLRAPWGQGKNKSKCTPYIHERPYKISRSQHLPHQKNTTTNDLKSKTRTPSLHNHNCKRFQTPKQSPKMGLFWTHGPSPPSHRNIHI